MIIFQFYFLHYIYQKHLNRLDAKLVLAISFLVNISYLAFFNFIQPVEEIPHSEYVWNRLSWLPFTGWIFYFSIGYYCGKYYLFFKQFSKKYKYLLFFGSVINLILVILLQHLGLPERVSSKRVDLLVLTTFLIPTLFYLSSNVHKLPPWLFALSNYSFSIYLLHKIFMHFHLILPIDQLGFFIISNFFLSVIGSIFIAWLMNKIPFGKYLVGNVANFKGRRRRRRKTQSKVTEIAG